MTGAKMDLRAALPADLTQSLIAVDGSGTLSANSDLLEHFGFFGDDN